MSHSVNQFEITVSKESLLHTLQANRETHQANYEKAMVVYTKECQDALHDRLEDLRNPENSIRPSQWLSFDNRMPVCYTYVYDQLIAMLQMAETETLTINGEQYRNWVQDEWDWTRQYSMSTLSKLG